MGSCFSKCKPKNSYLGEVEEDDGENVKQAISPAEKPPVSPSPSSASLTSLSSSSCSSAASNSSYSLSSFSSSSCSSKDRSFSNEFLRSCAKENQHVILMKPSKGNLERTSSLRPFLSSSPNAMPLKPSSPRRQVGGSTPKKRPRSNSPTLVRQKSFRKDNPQSVNTSTCHFPNRALRSPSPSRRFSADGQGKMDISPFRHGGAFNGVGKQNFKPASPNCQPWGGDSCSTKGNIVNSKRDGEVQSSPEMEDINNPLIALDCFIFL